MYKTGFGRWGLATLAIVALAGGVAWALETQTVSLPSGPSYAVTATLVPGSGGTVFGTGVITDEDVRFSVGLDATGVSIHGIPMGPCDPASPHTIHVAAYELNGEWFCDTTVFDDSTGLPIASHSGHAMGGPAGKAEAKAECVCSLAAE